MAISYVKGDLFSAPRGSILAHACNVYGVWGGGIALAFKAKFPSAFEAYRAHCHSKTPEELVGTTYLVKSDEKDPGGLYWIACLFTAAPSDGPDQIASNTGPAIRHLNQLLKEKGLSQPISMPMINAGIFGVPWEKTEKYLKESDTDITVYQL